MAQTSENTKPVIQTIVPGDARRKAQAERMEKQQIVKAPVVTGTMMPKSMLGR